MKLQKLICGMLAAAMFTEAISVSAADTAKTPDTGKWVWAELKENVSDDTITDPREDFHLYANKEWILKNQIPEGYTSYSHYMERQMDVDQEFRDLLTDDSLTGDLAKSVQEMYHTVLNWEERNALGYTPIEEELSVIDSIRNMEDLYAYITDTSNAYPDPLFSYYVDVDPEDSTKYIFNVGQTELLLEDAAEYSGRTENGQLTYDIYLSIFEYMMGRMGKTQEEAKSIFENAIELEAELAAVSYTTEDFFAEDIMERALNKMTVKELAALCPDYPMMDVLKSIGMENTGVVNVDHPEYFCALDDIVAEENLQAIKDLFTVWTVTGSCAHLDEATYRDCRKIKNDLYGIDGTISDEEMAYRAVNNIMPVQCQQLYVEVYGSEEKRQLVTQLCRQVIDTYAEMLRNNDYLSEETVEKAVEKLYAIRIHSLYPDKWPDVSACDFSGMSYYEALVANDRFETAYNLSKNGRDVDKDLWIDIGEELTVMDCNAFYNPYDNSINMIIGMMGEPFYSDDISVEGLYASLGAFWIGHEISHAFDSFGSQYDKDGNYVNWWTKEDRSAFDARIQKVDDYLSSIEVGNGNFVKGANVDTEMVADFTGLQCALRMAEKVENFDYKEFFQVYANMNATISTESDEISQLLSDPHPLDYLRTNVPVQQFEEFYQAYGVEEGDGMYLAPEDRLLVW